MNYLAHIHLAHISNTSLIGNFLGDFVKGSSLEAFSKKVCDGIKLHRKIDSFTDQHELIVELKQHFPNDLRRMAGIIIDVYFDHLLSANWNSYSQASLKDVLSKFYQQLAEFEYENHRFMQVKKGLLNRRWLTNYANISGCHTAFQHIESRLNRRIIFADTAICFIEKKSPLFESCFVDFYPEVITFSLTNNN